MISPLYKHTHTHLLSNEQLKFYHPETKQERGPYISSSFLSTAHIIVSSDPSYYKFVCACMFRSLFCMQFQDCLVGEEVDMESVEYEDAIAGLKKLLRFLDQ